jgi:hypothetical protein
LTAIVEQEGARPEYRRRTSALVGAEFPVYGRPQPSCPSPHRDPQLRRLVTSWLREQDFIASNRITELKDARQNIRKRWRRQGPLQPRVEANQIGDAATWNLLPAPWRPRSRRLRRGSRSTLQILHLVLPGPGTAARGTLQRRHLDNRLLAGRKPNVAASTSTTAATLDTTSSPHLPSCHPWVHMDVRLVPQAKGMLPGMTANITEGHWIPLPGALPEDPHPEKVYVIPTRKPLDDDGDDTPRYTDNVRFLPKEARAAGIPVEFATPEGTRKYLQEFSIDPEMWSLGLALLTLASDWLIFTVEQFINTRAKAQGWSDEAARELPLKVSIAETSTSRNIEIEGSGADVLEALRVLKQQSLDQQGGSDDPA